MDNIIVVKGGKIIENGSFTQLMASKGHLAQLVGDHVQIIEPTGDDFETSVQKKNDEKQEPHGQLHGYHHHHGHGSTSSSRRGSHIETLKHEQLVNRRRVSINQNMVLNDQNLSKHIENNQLMLIGGEFSRNNSIKVIERNRMSIVTMDHDDQPMPEDSEPMKLVLEDQSVNYKKIPMLLYLKAGKGTIITVLIFALFFLVHLVRIGSGKLILLL